MKNKVTIITTPHSDKRHPYLKRFLSYYEQFDSPPYIIVADSSPSPISDKNILEHLHASHVSYEKYSHDTRFEKKLLKAIEEISTPYAAICSEDDLITINGIIKASEQLDENDDIVAIYGYLVAFTSEENSISVRNAIPMIGVLDDSMEEREKYYISEYPSAVFSSIYRTKYINRIFKLAKIFTDDYEFGELLPAFLTPIYGKIYSLKDLYWVREIFPDSLGQSVGTYRLINIVEDGSYNYRYSRFKECMVKEINIYSDLDSKEAEKLVDKSFGKYFTKRFGCSYKQLRRKLFYKKVLKKTSVFSFAKRLKSKIKPNPVIVSQKQNYEDDPLFPKDEWDEMKMFLENNMISQ